MAPCLFISYRRSDTAHAARGLWSQLHASFGASRIFMDVAAIDAGSTWPDRLRAGLDQSAAVLALIGPGWLTAADQYGRRRLDAPDDWVRTELLHAVESGKTVIPVLVAGATMPPEEALPTDLRLLSTRQALRLTDESWARDVNDLVRLLVEDHGFVENTTRVRRPQPGVSPPALTPAEIDAALSELPGWEPVESSLPGDYPRTRQELRKSYEFPSFRKAMEFMQAALPAIHSVPDPSSGKNVSHHPRWENQWRTVTVHLSTWDIKHRISAIDVELAKALDRIYEEVRRR